jgi:hypothetical protein
MIDSVMNEKEFLKRLSEVSEWHRPQTGPNGCYSVVKGAKAKSIEHPGVITEQELEEMTDSEVKRYYDRLMAWREAQPNESVPPEILKVKVQARDCDDCGRHCPQGRRTQRKLHESGGRHWREYCEVCEHFKDPLTGLFTVNKEVSHQYFTQFYKPKLGKYKSKYQPKLDKETAPKATRQRAPSKLTKSQLVEKIINEGHWVTHETEDSITRVFVPKSP